MTHIPAGCSLATLKFQMPHAGGSRTAVFTFGIEAEPTLSVADLIGGLYNEHVWLINGSNQATFLSAGVMDEAFGYEVPQNTVGGHGGELPPPNVTLLVRKWSGIRGRKNQGRMFPPGLVYEGTFNNAGVMSSGDRGTYQEAFDNFLTALDTEGFPMVLLHNEVLPQTPVLALYVEGTAATQRRRLR